VSWRDSLTYIYSGGSGDNAGCSGGGGRGMSEVDLKSIHKIKKAHYVLDCTRFMLILKNFELNNNISSNKQFGFQTQKSTSMAILDMIDKVTNAMDSKSCSIGLFIDLAKAFDTVYHEILLAKLSHYGIRGLPLNLLRSYMTGRKQYVSCNNVNSEM